MNRRSFSGGIASVIAELDLDFSNLSGMGGASYPLLFWQMQLHLHPQPSSSPDYVFRLVEAQLCCADHQKIADATPHPLYRVLRAGYEKRLNTEYLNLEFPLDVRRIHALEQQRNGGGVRLFLKVQLQVEEHGVIDAHAESKRPERFGLRALHRLALEETVEISQSAWVDRVLPQIGFGKVHVLELPAVPIDACRAAKHAFDSLRQAQELHKIGLYDDAVAKCRVALDPFFEMEERTENDGVKRKVPVLKKSWETRVGQSTYRWLKETLGALKAEANTPHHSPNTHYDQMESQMILSITTAVIAYSARVAET